MTTRRLALILGDQLSFDLPSLQALDPQQDAVLLAEVAHNAPEGRVGSTTGGVLVDTTGRVANALVVKSSGSAVLDRAAREQALTWTFTPARRRMSSIRSIV